MAAGRVYLDEKGSTRFKLPRQPIVMEDLVVRARRGGPLQTHQPARRPGARHDHPPRGRVVDFPFRQRRGRHRDGHHPRHSRRGPSFQYAQAHRTLSRRSARRRRSSRHIPLILNRSGGKMSKRDEGASVQSYIDGGYVPEAVANYLCLLGWSPKDNREKLDMSEVVALFELDKINRRNAVVRRRQVLLAQRPVRPRDEPGAVPRAVHARDGGAPGCPSAGSATSISTTSWPP